MHTTKHTSLPSLKIFISRILRNLLIGIIVIALSLGIGIVGYHHFEQMEWIDAFVNASMILSGMGPVSTLNSYHGKLFAGFYALFSGIVFLLVMAIIIAPVFHRFLHRFHLNDTK